MITSRRGLSVIFLGSLLCCQNLRIIDDHRPVREEMLPGHLNDTSWMPSHCEAGVSAMSIGRDFSRKEVLAWIPIMLMFGGVPLLDAIFDFPVSSDSLNTPVYSCAVGSRGSEGPSPPVSMGRLRMIAEEFRVSDKSPGPRRIAILPVETPRETKTDSIVYSVVFRTLFHDERYTLFEREKMEEILREQSLQSSGISGSEVVEIGRLSGAGYLVFIRIQGRRVSLRMVDVETGAIAAFAEGDITKED